MVRQYRKLVTQAGQHPGDRFRVPGVAEAKPPIDEPTGHGKAPESFRHTRLPFFDKLAGHLRVDVGGVGLNAENVEASVGKNPLIGFD